MQSELLILTEGVTYMGQVLLIYAVGVINLYNMVLLIYMVGINHLYSRD